MDVEAEGFMNGSGEDDREVRNAYTLIKFLGETGTDAALAAKYKLAADNSHSSAPFRVDEPFVAPEIGRGAEAELMRYRCRRTMAVAMTSCGRRSRMPADCVRREVA